MVGTVAYPHNTWEDTNADDTAVIYYYKLKAFNTDNVEGQFSVPESGTPGADNLVLYTPNPNANLPADVDTQFTWGPVQGASYYYLEIGTVGLANLYLAHNVPATVTDDVILYTWSAGATGHSAGNFGWRVSAYSSGGM
ncbi:MAG: hypothetical protein COS84_08260, partial [Armatimonadetes bacterium CG07_land_8_20_14_0_80_40_9]